MRGARKENGYGSIFAARRPGSRYWHRRRDCAEERQEEESPVTESSCVRILVGLEGSSDLGNDERVSARYAHWAVVSVLVSAITLWMAAVPWAVPDATPVQERRIEIAIRDSVYVCTKTMPVLAGVPTLLVIRNEDPVQHGFVSPVFAALYIRLDWEGIEVPLARTSKGCISTPAGHSVSWT